MRILAGRAVQREGQVRGLCRTGGTHLRLLLLLLPPDDDDDDDAPRRRARFPRRVGRRPSKGDALRLRL
jgi:hypothetical protein